MQENNDLIYETDFWRIILSEDQENLGRCVIVLKRSCPNLSELKDEEVLDFLNNIIKKLESACKKAFKATMFNWTCLMNAGYMFNPPAPQVHWHFRPRYDHQVDFAGETFIDESFGKHYKQSTDRKVSVEIQEKIISEIKKFI